MHRISLFALLALTLATLLLAGCAAKTPPPTTPPPQVVTPPAPFVERPIEKTEDLTIKDAAFYNKQGVLVRINFETDKWDITPEARRILKENAAWVLAHPEFRLSVEGHCDERNTEAYNLALGERRANAAKEYLVGLGVPADRVSTVSYGKAKPLCNQANDSCYSENRRGEFILIDLK